MEDGKACGKGGKGVQRRLGKGCTGRDESGKYGKTFFSNTGKKIYEGNERFWFLKEEEGKEVIKTRIGERDEGRWRGNNRRLLMEKRGDGLENGAVRERRGKEEVKGDEDV